MFTAAARVRTPHASKYLVQLSKHWSHRFPELVYDTGRADIPLPGGPLVLEAAADELQMTVRSPARESLARMQEVVTEHLQRFALREPLEVSWTTD